MSYYFIISAWLVLFIITLAAFALRRAALAVARVARTTAEANYAGAASNTWSKTNQIANLLMPPWFPIIWVAILLKWAAVLLMGLNHSWGVSIGLVVIDTVATTALPLPLGVFAPLFRARIAKLTYSDPISGVLLKVMLTDSIVGKHPTSPPEKEQ